MRSLFFYRFNAIGAAFKKQTPKTTGSYFPLSLEIISPSRSHFDWSYFICGQRSLWILIVLRRMILPFINPQTISELYQWKFKTFLAVIVLKTLLPFTRFGLLQDATCVFTSYASKHMFLRAGGFLSPITASVDSIYSHKKKRNNTNVPCFLIWFDRDQFVQCNRLEYGKLNQLFCVHQLC